MECLKHPSQPAVASCKSCGRAICRACAKDLGFAVVCSEICRVEATDLHEMNQRAKGVYGVGCAPKRFPMASVTLAAFGTLFLAFGARAVVEGTYFGWFPLLFGAVCAVLAVVSYRRVRDMQFNY